MGGGGRGGDEMSLDLFAFYSDKNGFRG